MSFSSFRRPESLRDVAVDRRLRPAILSALDFLALTATATAPTPADLASALEEEDAAAAASKCR
eukprot:CAMPEP_0113592118 /NCGR_PEP_ID=MMETSP0015_2-20120614/37658_1 /TAXON_ID=2838 /ORGANISM="Odontella" /LENGTH=63 /DNA_ID=CAMNT_0000498597 /DNA_START=42 /DNA_END=230 /DNA_ORIENTATION=- /assembly_acc=CAM_ASM_000160